MNKLCRSCKGSVFERDRVYMSGTGSQALFVHCTAASKWAAGVATVVSNGLVGNSSVNFSPNPLVKRAELYKLVSAVGQETQVERWLLNVHRNSHG